MKKIQWIKPAFETGAAAVDFKKTFKITKPVEKATLQLSSMGNYAAFFNGERLSAHGILTPGYTSLKKRVQYFTYDVTALIGAENTIDHTVAPGWGVGHIGYDGGDRVFHENLAAVAELEIKYTDGSIEYINTDETWEIWSTPVTKSDIYHGETRDENLVPEKLGRTALDLDISAALVAQAGEDIVENERIAPVELIITPKGERVVDFGQNMTGYVEFKLKGKKGEIIEATCAEILDRDGNFYNENYRAADSRMTYILDGREHTYKPLYTFFGFRYIRLEKYPEGEIDLDSIRAVVVHSALRRTGHFSCGNEKINQLYHNVIWGQKSNYLDVPTDCPQRDERLGWTGDAQVFCRTAALNFDVRKFFEKWLGDMRLEQRADGAVTGTIPETYKLGGGSLISAAWGDCAVIAPWQLYDVYGDKNILRDNFEMMKKWADYIHNFGPEEHLWLGGHHYGDWLAMDLDVDASAGATNTDFIGSAFYVNALHLVIEAGTILGEDVSEYAALYNKAWNRFREYFMENGLPIPFKCLDKNHKNYDNALLREGITQTAVVLILKFGLYKPEERAGLVAKLCHLIELCDGRMTTGFVGTPYILHVLSDNGRADEAYKLLFNEGTPSWLYSVNHGATTMWEHWNGVKEDGTFWNVGMNSYNHYAYGAVADWIYANVAGIKNTAPGFESIKFEPKPNKDIGFVNCSIETVKGHVESNWYYKGDRVYFEFCVPAGVKAGVVLPDGRKETIGEGIYHFTV